MAIVFTAYFGLNGPHALPSSNRVTLFELLADSSLTGYTAYRADGFYDNNSEPTEVVVAIGQCTDESRRIGPALEKVCRRYKLLTGQQEVWITRHEEELEVV